MSLATALIFNTFTRLDCLQTVHYNVPGKKAPRPIGLLEVSALPSQSFRAYFDLVQMCRLSTLPRRPKLAARMVVAPQPDLKIFALSV